jgi:hypothetical protein
MRKFELFWIEFIVYIYVNYIYEDWSIYKPMGKIYYYPGWLYKSILTWVVCPIFIPEFLFKKTSIYEHIQKLKNDTKYQAQIFKNINSVNL